jgi:hypothetical protein
MERVDDDARFRRPLVIFDLGDPASRRRWPSASAYVVDHGGEATIAMARPHLQGLDDQWRRMLGREASPYGCEYD